LLLWMNLRALLTIVLMLRDRIARESGSMIEGARRLVWWCSSVGILAGFIPPQGFEDLGVPLRRLGGDFSRGRRDLSFRNRLGSWDPHGNDCASAIDAGR
jgi:hypothetical protein